MYEFIDSVKKAYFVIEDETSGLYYVSKFKNPRIKQYGRDFYEIGLGIPPDPTIVIEAEVEGGTLTAIEKMPELDITDREVLNLIFDKTKEDS